jgi:hypothetical protein
MACAKQESLPGTFQNSKQYFAIRDRLLIKWPAEQWTEYNYNKFQ